MPQFAPQTFRAWWKQRKPVNEGKTPVVLWVDTFNNHFHPEILQAAVSVLESTGHRIILPEQKLCCGRPLYDFGMLDHAKKMLAEILLSLRSEIRAGIPIVGLEPSCVSVFRDELKRLFPYDEDAARLAKNAMPLGEFLVEHTKFNFPRVVRRAVVHGHCPDKAVLKMKSTPELLKRAGLEFEIFDAGCCGMAGSFGFEVEHYDVSVRCGERMLLPKVRETPAEVWVIADGFSCREQIKQLTGRRAMHTAEAFLKILADGTPANPDGKQVYPPHTVPEMQEQSELKNRTRAQPVEV